MVNVGLRAYLWEQKSREQKLVRELWELNGVTYHGYREFVRFMKDHGLSEIYNSAAAHHASQQQEYAAAVSGGAGAMNRVPSGGHTAPSQQSAEFEDGCSEASMPSTHSSVSHHRHNSFSGALSSSSSARSHAFSSAAGSVGPSSAFAVAKHMFDVDSVVAVTVVRFARGASPPQLAMGLANGVIKIGCLAEPPSIVREFKGHNKAVSDLDWAPDNLVLLTAGLDGHVVAWNVANGQAVRAMSWKSEAACCRFHPVNPNLFVVGTSDGEVSIVNCSTGITVATVDTRLTPGSGPPAQPPIAMACTPSLLCIGDDAGYLHTWRAEIRDGQLQPLQLLCRLPPPRGTEGSLTGLDCAQFCKATGGPALVSAFTDGSVCIWDLDTWTGRPKLKGRGKLLQAEGRLKAAINAMVCPGDSQYMAVGARDNSVEVYDISDGIRKAPKLVARLTGHASTVTDASWNSGEPLLASSDTMGTVIVWEKMR